MGAVEEEIVVYLRGREGIHTVWYRLVVETTSSELSKGEKRDRKGQTISQLPVVKDDIGIISPIASIPGDEYGFHGGWAVIGDDIYWTGGRRMIKFELVTLSKDLLKHNIHDEKDLTSWEKVSSLNIPRAGPFLVPLGRNNLAIVAGTSTGTGHMDDDNCGEVYDIDSQSFLHYITPHIKRFASYSSSKATRALEDPTQIAFYNLDLGSVLILDTSNNVIITETNCNSLALRRVSSPEEEDPPLPQGLEGCESITPLVVAATMSPPVFHKRTLYWFTSEMMLYGYDMDLDKWFRSESLQQILSPIKHEPPRKITHTLLLGLPNGKFMVFIFQKRAQPTMASLYVEKKSGTTTLDVNVNVDYIRHFHLSNPSVRPSDGIAIRSKNTGPDK